jgi:hypothetical protein
LSLRIVKHPLSRAKSGDIYAMPFKFERRLAVLEAEKLGWKLGYVPALLISRILTGPVVTEDCEAPIVTSLGIVKQICS